MFLTPWLYLVLHLTRQVSGFSAGSGKQEVSTSEATSHFSVSQRAEIIVALKHYFRSGLVFLLQSQAQLQSRKGRIMTMKAAKYLASEGISSAVIHINSSFLHVQSGFSRSLRVLLTANFNICKLFEDYRLNGVIWLAFLEEGQSARELLGTTYVRFDVLFLLARRAGTHVEILEAFRVTPEGPLLSRSFGILRGSMFIPESQSYYRRSLESNVIRTAIVNEPPLTITARGNKFAGFNGLLWSIFEEKLNFKTEVRIPGDNLWGSLKNGTWNGAMGMVLRKEVEAAVCGLGMTSKRAAYVRFITPVAVLRDKIFIRMTDTYVSGSWNNFLRSFSAGLWLTVAAFIFLMAIFFNVCYHIGVNHHKEESYELTLIECIFFVLAAFCQQGQTRTPLSFQCRLVFFTSYLLGVVLFCAYSAAIISFLTVRHVELPFNDLMQLKQDATYTLGVVDASMKLSKFQDAKSGILKDVYTTNILPGLKTLPRSVQSGLQKVCATPKYAFLAPIEKGAVYFPTLCCELFVLPKEVSFMPISIAFPKNSPYIELFDFFVKRLKETGILDKVQRQSLASVSETKRDNSAKSVRLEDTTPILCILVAGAVLSVFLLLLEHVYRPD